jgi:Protein of unknown function (DUF2833)
MSNEAKACKPFVREAKLVDVLILGANIRQADRWEIWHIARKLPVDAFLEGYKVSDKPYVIEWKGMPIAMFGVSGTKGSVGVPWMLGTDDIKKVGKSLLRECRSYVDKMHDDYPVLTNYVWTKNTVHIQWLKWLGFQFGEAVPLGPDQELFYHFSRSQ